MIPFLNINSNLLQSLNSLRFYTFSSLSLPLSDVCISINAFVFYSFSGFSGKSAAGLRLSIWRERLPSRLFLIDTRAFTQ